MIFFVNFFPSSWYIASIRPFHFTVAHFPCSADNWTFLRICLHHYSVTPNNLPCVWSDTNGIWRLPFMGLDQGKIKIYYLHKYIHMYLRKWNSNFALPLISELQQNRNIIYCFCDSCVSLDRHNKCVHLKIKRFMCTICTKGFITKDGLISHKRKEHQSDSPEQSTCFICNSRFLNKFALKSHFRTNHKNGICNQCGKRFKNLKQHFIQVHNKSFTCDTCKKQFGRRNSLDIHVRTVHENDKPHKCDQCEKSFGENSVSQTHMKIVHENIKPFKCDTCSKAFGTKGGLIRHNNEIHENKNRIKCHLCKNT